MGYDLTHQQCVLNSRHTDCTDYGQWTEKICVRGRQWISYKDFDIKGQKTWAGDGRCAWGGGVAGKPWPVLDFNENLCVGARVMGAFGGDCSLEGGGYARPPPHSPFTDRSLCTQNARENRWLGHWTLPHSKCACPPPPAPNQ
jgi:hypothetical protein